MIAVRLLSAYRLWNSGEIAGFPVEEAQAMVAAGIAVIHDPAAEVAAAKAQAKADAKAAKAQADLDAAAEAEAQAKAKAAAEAAEVEAAAKDQA